MAKRIFHISSGDYRASVSSYGASLNSLTFQTRNLIEPDVVEKHFGGNVLAPWPNRIADGRYTYESIAYTADINEVNRQTALHGLVYESIWEVLSHSTSDITLTTSINASDKYPTALNLEMAYRLNGDGISATLTCKNTGEKSAPYGASIHPYLTLGNENPVGLFRLELPCSQVMLTDDLRLLPTAIAEVESQNFDFRTGDLIGDRFIDHAFKVDLERTRAVTITGRDGRGVAMTFDDQSKWIQIHTADREGAPSGRKSLAVEPMSCPPDAFNSALDLIELSPGQKHSMTWSIKAI